MYGRVGVADIDAALLDIVTKGQPALMILSADLYNAKVIAAVKSDLFG